MLCYSINTEFLMNQIHILSKIIGDVKVYEVYPSSLNKYEQYSRVNSKKFLNRQGH